jgi:hypothetical protein
MGALGAIVSDDGIGVEPGRWETDENWPTLFSPRDILRFMGVFGWMSDYLPQLNELAASL